MSESAKKKLKQMRLPFAIITEPDKTPGTPEENLSPKANVSSRKRKPSYDADNVRSTKIGRVAYSKENISAEQEVIEVSNSEDDVTPESQRHASEQAAIKTSTDNETTPTTTAHESVLHIKLPSCTKSKRKINMDLNQPKSIDEEDLDDSVVYLDKEEIPKGIKKLKKSVKKSEKRKQKKESSDSKDKIQSLAKPDVLSHLTSDNEDELDKTESNKSVEQQHDDEVMIVDDDIPEPSPISIKKSDKNETEDEIASKEGKTLPVKKNTIGTIPSNASSPLPEDPEEIHEEIAEVLSDDSEANKLSPSGNDGVRKTPTNKIDLNNLTPKQLARRQELETRRLEKELQRQKERDLKENQRLKEKEQREEAKRKEKEEKEEARKREKEERDRKRQAEQDKKDEEKRQKEEERKRAADQREEEKRQKEEERKRQIEMREEDKRKRDEVQKKKELEDENRKKRAAEAFSKFFVPKKKIDASVAVDDASKDTVECGPSSAVVKSNFIPFQIRERMKVAPCVRLQIDKDQLKTLDESLKTVKPLNELYLSELKNGLHKPSFSSSTWPLEEKDDDDDVSILDELDGAGEDIQMSDSDKKMKQRAKYLMFIENRRPAYHGTWCKKTTKISARRPFAQDPKFFDYEVDSDDEWEEEEEPGESLHGSDSEKEKEVDEEEYEVDNDFFVPHGHLSDEEMQQMDGEAFDENHPEAQKAKLKILQQEFAAEMKKKTEKIKPRLIGCVWMNGDEDEMGCSKIGSLDKKYHCSSIIWRILKAREMMTSDEGVKLEDNLEAEVADTEEESEKTSAPSKVQVRAKFNEGSVKELIKLVHGNTNSKKFIIKEFQAYRLKNFHKDPDFLEFSVRTIDEKMMEISDYKTCPEEGPMFNRKCWLVKPEVFLEHYGDEKLPLPNEWTYILEKKVKERKPKLSIDASKPEELKEKVDLLAQKPADEKTFPSLASSAGNPPQKTPIDDAKKLCFIEANDIKRPQQPVVNATKKRVQLLMSVPRGEEISQSKKNNLISQYLKGKEEAAAINTKSKVIDDVIIN